ncbi:MULTISPECIES: hypothetical protein [Sphingomonadaceae]|uniref:hypothetical protein n=1 Tax=Sphingomonadaceae TaxID=41297 RepID=UPI001F5C6E09|nr:MULTISPECIES: hypothetical protein [Sphingomonadaceae]
MFLLSARAYLQHGVLALLFVLAMRRGAAPERIISATILGMLVVDRMFHLFVGIQPMLVLGVNFAHLAIDVIGFAVFLMVALGANRVYPLWIAGSQLIALLSHVYPAMAKMVSGQAYVAMNIMPSYVQMIALALGLLAHMRRQKRLGSYPSWRKSWLLSPGNGRRRLPAA